MSGTAKPTRIAGMTEEQQRAYNQHEALLATPITISVQEVRHLFESADDSDDATISDMALTALADEVEMLGDLIETSNVHDHVRRWAWRAERRARVARELSARVAAAKREVDAALELELGALS